MMKSQLVKRIASQNPHLFERDIEKVVSAIFDAMVEALRPEIESNFGVLERSRLSSEKHAKGATLKPVLPFRSQRKLFPPSRRGRKCARGLIEKPSRQPNSRHSSTLTNRGRGAYEGVIASGTQAK